MNIEYFSLAFQVCDALATAAVGIYVYLSNKDKVTNDRISTLEASVDNRLDNHGERVARVEEAILHVPTHEDLGSVHTRINEMGQGVHTLTGEVRGMHRTLMLIQQHLLSGTSSK
ncbi:hypothetical protein AB3X91_03685 [Paraburkholderia sp. BR14263]|uniref:hypothetical protein n=1 Tax=unclassified Paraburkholderia TaxID=2615204 RepID=UPI0034CEE7BB